MSSTPSLLRIILVHLFNNIIFQSYPLNYSCSYISNNDIVESQLELNDRISGRNWKFRSVPQGMLPTLQITHKSLKL